MEKTGDNIWPRKHYRRVAETFFIQAPAYFRGAPIHKALLACPFSNFLNVNKWITDDNRMQDYCISVTFEYEKATRLYDAIKTNIRTRARVR